MEFKMFSIMDTKAAVFHPPFFKQTHAEAERDFANLANNQQTSIGQNPEDFDLYIVGTYDDQTGKMVLPPSPQHVQKAVHLVKPKSPQLEKIN